MMKNYTMAKAFAFIVTLFASHSLFAQQARVQIIHNAAGNALDTVDVYVNDQLIDNVAFRTATGILRLNPGTYNINLNHKSSIDSGDQVLARFSTTLAANANNFGHVIMVTGVEDTANYAANPDEINAGVQLIIRRNVTIGTTNQGITPTTVVHGVTDAPGVNITTRPLSTILSLSNLKYGDTTNNIFLPAQQSFIDVIINSNNTLFKSYIAPLNLFRGRSLVVFASGFIDPSINQNGQSFGLFAIDTNGGAAVALPEGFRMQIVHAAIDTEFDSVDVWVNGTRSISSLRKLRSTPMLNLVSGNTTITMTKAGSSSDMTDVLYTTGNISVPTGQSVLVMVSGVKDTTAFPTNPDGIDRTLAFNGFEDYSELPLTAGQLTLSYFNGVTNAGNIMINRGGATQIPMFDATAFNKIDGPISIPTSGNNAYVLRENINGELTRTYRFRVPAAFANRKGVLFSAGFKEDASLPAGVLSSSYYIAFTNGDVISLEELNAFVQIVHASADPAAAVVDVYIDGVKALDDFAYTSATPFLPVTPYKNLSVSVAPANSTSVADAVYTTTLVADSSRFHYAVASGLLNPSGFAPNPDNVDRAFAILVNNQARLDATINPKNVDLMYFHSMTDAPRTESKGFNQQQFLSRNNPYKSFHGYRAHSAFAEIDFDLLVADSGTLLFSGQVDLLSHQGKTGLVVASGFRVPAANNNGREIKMYIVWPEGAVDSFNNTTSLSKTISKLNGFNVYPNPAINHASILFDIDRNSNVDVVVTDINGREVYTTSQLATYGSNEIAIPTQNFNAGIYFIKVCTSHASGYSKLIISK
jgi:hypothetical protein